MADVEQAREEAVPQAVKSGDADVLKRVQSWANCRDNEAHDRYALGYIRELIRPIVNRTMDDASEFGAIIRDMAMCTRGCDEYAHVAYGLGQINAMAEQAIAMIGGES